MLASIRSPLARLALAWLASLALALPAVAQPAEGREYVRLKSPQPVENVGPLLPDSDRVGLSFGVGMTCGKWRLDLSDLYLPFIDRDTLGRNSERVRGRARTRA